ncbi:MAG: DUF1565 domain-containing protein, partial [Candidatus Diapherotrites archaeon]|nr:DUF1565 domain-containing protein [Candidatus Diapherotrites archaeon]
MRFKLLLLVFFLLFAGFAFSATYNVSITGSDSNPGSEAQPFRTIQKCTGMVSPGDSCIVSAGGYNENVNLSRGGSAGSPVTFKANGAVVTSQINISAPYVIVDGFDITGTSEAVAWRGMISVGTGAHYCQILNNTLHDVPFDSASGIEFNKGGNLPSQSAGHCIVKGNIIKDIGYVSLFLFGDSHLIENNTFDGANGGGFDVIQPFGAHHIFRGNYFTNMWENGHHTDIIQTFGNNGDSAYDIIFENNTITNSEAQLCNLSQDGIADIRDWTFRNNLLVNVAYSCNVYIPNVSFYNNTFINTRIDTIFLNINQNDARNAGAASNARVFNNLFVDSGMHANNSLYSVGAGVLSTFQANNNYIAGSPP